MGYSNYLNLIKIVELVDVHKNIDPHFLKHLGNTLILFFLVALASTFDLRSNIFHYLSILRLKAVILDDYVEMYKGQVLLRMGAKGKSPILAKRVRSLVNFRSGHELFMFALRDEES